MKPKAQQPVNNTEQPKRKPEPRKANRLTDPDVKNAKSDGLKNRVLPDGYGLRLVVTPAQRKYWQFKTKVGNRESTTQLGIYDAMSLTDARSAAERMRALVKEGHSPVAHNRVRKIRNRLSSDTTFQGVAEELLAVKRRTCSPAYYKKISGGIRANLFPTLGMLPITSIDAPILREALRKIEARGALEMLGNVRRWAGEIFEYAKADGKYPNDNPAASLVKNQFERHRGDNMRALEWEDVQGFVGALKAMQVHTPTTAIAARLVLLTACRPGEVRGARWSEIDFDRARWNIPKERMKKRMAHSVPLSMQALIALNELKELTGGGEYLFPARVGAKAETITDMTLLKAVKRAANKDVHAHGLRAVFSTHVSDSLKWQDVVKEAALAHYKGNVEGRYDHATHYKERAKLMQWYADEIDMACKGADVIPLKSKTVA